MASFAVWWHRLASSYHVIARLVRPTESAARRKETRSPARKGRWLYSAWHLYVCPCTRSPPIHRRWPAVFGEVDFANYTPLSGNLELMRRMLSPLAEVELTRKVAGAGATLGGQPLDLANETFALYVPARTPPQGYVLVVFVPPDNAALLPDGLGGPFWTNMALYMSGRPIPEMTRTFLLAANLSPYLPNKTSSAITVSIPNEFTLPVSPAARASRCVLHSPIQSFSATRF